MDTPVMSPSFEKPRWEKQSIPLVVDLDGTLLRTDLLVEGVLALIRHNPWKALAALQWIMVGRAFFKARIAAIVRLSPKLLPYREEVMEEIRDARSQGRQVVLCTASNEIWANEISDYLGLFDEIIGSSGLINLKGRVKAEVLVERFGDRGFTYIGDSRSDLPIWLVAAEAISVGHLSTGGGKIRFTRVIRTTGCQWRSLLAVCRPHQWVKNLLVIVPLVAAHKVLDTAKLWPAFLAFIAFSCIASATYLLNDLIDIEADRTHPTKRLRPFASGAVPVSVGLFMLPVLLAVGAAIGSMLGILYLSVLGTYLGLTLLYSLKIKRLLLLDVILLSGFFTLRIVAGGLACSVRVSSWLLAFSSCIFLSLALVKRFSELNKTLESGGLHARRRAYLSSDASILAALGLASGVSAALVLTIYVSSPDVTELYQSPKLLLLVCPLVTYWIGRLWILANRGCIQEDPLVHALQDRATYGVAVCVAAVAILASIYKAV